MLGESRFYELRIVAIILSVMLLMACGSDAPEEYVDIVEITPAPTLVGSVGGSLFEPRYSAGRCNTEIEPVMGTDFPLVEGEEQGWPDWEERFLHVNVVARVKLHSIYPGMVALDDGKGAYRYYPALQMNFRVFEIFRGSVSLDYLVVWQVGWEYYTSIDDAHCVALEDIVKRRDRYEYLDHDEAILFLTITHNSDWLEDIARYIGNYFVARLPSEMDPPNSLETEQLRWLPNYDGDTFYDRKYPEDSLGIASVGTVTKQELREVGRNLEELRSTHDLECVYNAYRQARIFDEDIEALMEGCVRDR